MNLTNRFLLIAALTSASVASAWAQGYVNTLPLNITSADQLYSAPTNSNNALIEVVGTNQLSFTKPNGTTTTGESTTVIKFDGIPGFLTLDMTSVTKVTCGKTSGDHNYLVVSESADGTTYTNENKYSCNANNNAVISLNKETRYIKFYYVVAKNKATFLSGSYCGHGFNPAKIDLPASLDITDESVKFAGKEGHEYKDTISVSYSNPTGNLAFEVTNSKFAVRKLTDDAEAAKAGTAQFEVSYPGEEVSEAEGTLKIYDSGYTDAFESIPLTANIEADVAPAVPSTPTVSASSYTGATLSWEAVEGAASYRVTLTPVAQTRVAAEELVFEVTEPTITFTDLALGTTYNATVQSVSETGKVSEPTATFTFSTKAVTAPTGLSTSATQSSLTATWLAVDGITGYVVSLLEGDAVVETATLGADVLTYTFDGLTKGTTYTVSLNTVDGEYSSEALAAAATTNIDFGPQMANAGFENWEAVSKGSEPVNWNSFATAGGSVATGILSNTVKQEQVKQSTDVRPNTTGTSSANIYARSVAGVIANGNLTTGKINAGSMTADSYDNYNAVDPTDANFYQVIDQTPDSVTVWVKNTGSGEARLSFILHGEGIVKDPAAEVSDLTVATAQYNYDACDWTRLAVPFEMVHEGVTPRYMLATFTTNKTPGAGSKNDNVYVDDIVLVYKPSLAVSALGNTSFSEGDTLKLAYTLSGSMSVSNLNAPANTVYAELSDEEGNFDNATVVSDVVTTDASGELAVTLPASLVTSSNYRIRVMTTNYPMTSELEDNLTIEGTKNATALGQVASAPASRLYPNPAKSVVYLTNAQGAVVTVRNLAGATVKTGVYGAAGLDIADLAQGVYFIDIRKDGTAEQLKFIKE